MLWKFTCEHSCPVTIVIKSLNIFGEQVDITGFVNEAVRKNSLFQIQVETS